MKYRRNKKHKLQIIACLFLIEISFLFLTCKSFTNKNVTEAKEYANFNKNSFALYVEDENGVYVEIKDSNTFPTGYNLNTSKSVCTDTDGNRVEGILSYKDDTVILASRKTVFCYLYFDQVLPDLTVIVEDENNSGILPNTPGYTKNITCKNGSAPVWNYKYDRVEFSNVVGEEEVCRVTYTKDNNTYLKLTNVVTANAVNEGSAGYRYEGANPNNYIWFNNEMWRIIGSIPVNIDYKDENYEYVKTESLVKIIRNNSLGAFQYNSNAGGTGRNWGENSLHTILNDYYYGQSKYGCEETEECKDDFSVKGINPSSSYGKMIKKVYWYIGNTGDTVKASKAFSNELTNKTSKTYRIGLISISDYGYAASSAYHENTLDTYGDNTQNNWLFMPGWTIQHDTALVNGVDTSINARHLNSIGVLSTEPYIYLYNVRPVVYLKEEVYVVTGDGTEANPYQIVMN